MANIQSIITNGNGNVLIGTTTDAGFKLQVNGTSAVMGGNQLRLYRTDNATYGSIQYLTGAGGFKFDDVNGDGYTFAQGANVRLSIATTGNVGINNTNPGVKLQVTGGSTDTSGQVIIGGTATNYTSGIDFYTSTTGRGFVGWRGPSSAAPYNAYGMYLVCYDNSPIIFGTDTGGRKMSINDNGNVLIGTTTDSGYKLAVNGTITSANYSYLSTYGYGATQLRTYEISTGTSVSDNQLFNLYLGRFGNGYHRITLWSTGYGTDSGNYFDITRTWNGTPYIITNGGLIVGGAQYTIHWAAVGTGQYDLFIKWYAGMPTGYSNQINYAIQSNTGYQYVQFDYPGGVTVPTLDGSNLVASRMTIQYTTGNVGIGTTSPGSKLEVSGGLAHFAQTATTGSAFRWGSFGTAVSPDTMLCMNQLWNGSGWTILDANYGTTAINLGSAAASPTMQFQTGGANTSATTKMIILNNGDVGIGTTAPTALLTVAGTADLAWSASTSKLQISRSSTVARLQNYENGSASTNLALQWDGGNVGIGTTAPTNKLHIDSTDDNAYALRVQGNTNNVLGVWTGIGIAGEGSNTKTAIIFEDIGVSYSRGKMHFALNNAADQTNATPANAVMTLTPNGNVGIGTTGPVTPLQVVSATNDVDVLRIGNTAGNSGSVQGFTHLAINHFDAGTFPSTRITAYQDGVSGWPGGMYFSTREVNTDSAPLERLRITSAGSIGINTTNPTSRLEVVGDARITTGSLGVGVAPNATDGRIDASNDIVAFSTSDRRLKENITPIANALEKVRSLTGVEFDWKEETKHVHGYEGHDVGVIAQDVQAVLPEAVRTNDSGYLSVRYEKMIALLVEANKELANRVEQLEKLIK